MEKIIVIGCGNFGKSVSFTLEKLGKKVMVIDKDSTVIKRISNFVSYSSVLDATNLNSLILAKIADFDAAVVGFSTSVENSIIVTTNLKALGIKHIIARANDEIHSKILRKIGANQVILPESEMGLRLANNLKHTNLFEIVHLSSECSVTEVNVSMEWNNKPLSELEISSTCKSNVLAIKNAQGIKILPQANDVVKNNDILIVVGSTKCLENL